LMNLRFGRKVFFYLKNTALSKPWQDYLFLLPSMLIQCWHRSPWGSQKWHFVLCRELHSDNKCLGGLHPKKHLTQLLIKPWQD
jgi:hypothetical protein